MHRRRRLCDLNMARDLLNTRFRALEGAFVRETGALKHCNYPHRASPTRRMAEKLVMEGQEGQVGGGGGLNETLLFHLQLETGVCPAYSRWLRSLPGSFEAGTLVF